MQYTLIDTGYVVDTLCDLLSFDWQNMAAVFQFYGDNSRALRIRFDADAIVRLLDEFPLSTESHPDSWNGLVAHGFAYRVDGASFVEQQSPTWIEVMAPVTHYRFITGNGCLDVLTSTEPIFDIVDRTRL